MPHESTPHPPTGRPSGPGRRPFEVLLNLLEDDSPVVVEGVRAEFLRAGRVGEKVLRRALRSGSARRRGRARQLLLAIERRRVVRRLIRRASSGIDLESGLFLLDNYWSPGLDVRPYVKALDAMAEMVRRRAASQASAVQRAQALIHVLSTEMGFNGAVEDFHHPDNIYLSRSIERRRGMPLTLCAIFAFVAARAEIRASLLPFPGHILLRLEYGSDRRESLIVDPFGGGQVLSERQCMGYLAEHRLAFRPEWLQAASPAHLFARHVRNLRQSCRARGRFAEVRELGLVLRAGAQTERPKTARHAHVQPIPDHWPPEDATVTSVVPMFPLPRVVLFPRQLMPLHVFEPRYRRMVEDSLDGPGRLVIATLEDADSASESPAPAVLPVGGLGEIARHERLEDGRFLIWVFGLARVRLREVASDQPYRLVECEPLVETVPSKAEEERLRPALTAAIRSRSDKLLNLPPDVPISLLTDLLSQRMALPQETMAKILSEHDTVRRADRALAAHLQFPPLQPPTGDE